MSFNEADVSDAPARPVPTTGAVSRSMAWIEWFGVWRLIASAVAVGIVCAGSYWLLRTPPPPTEALLPLASAPPSSIAAPSAPTTTDVPAVVTVHVAGAVVSPGVFQLPGSNRVAEAVRAAGGATADGDPDALNLAAPLTDGSRIYVPKVGEVPPPTLIAADIADGQVEGSPAVPVDVNTAAADELDELPGIGPATATAIITERDRNGPFFGVDDLDRVPGIGPAKLEALRDLVTT